MTASLIYPLAPFLALAISYTAVRWLARHPGGLPGALDRPNHRSLHDTPVPRTGGLGLLAGVLVALALLVPWGLPPGFYWLVGALVPLAGVSLRDDFCAVAPHWRLGVQVLAALLLLAGGLGWIAPGIPGLAIPLPTLLAGLVSVLIVVWAINLYNFMDGMDGLAATMAICGFGAYALLGWLAGAPAFAAAAAAVAASAAGFLAFNAPPARIFLGDVGSTALGLLAIGFALIAERQGLFPLWLAALIFSPFIADASWTLFARLLRGAPVWRAHREHHYQRLILAGWTHRQTLRAALLPMLACTACAVAAPRLTTTDQRYLLLGWAAIYVVIHFKVRVVECRAAGARK